MAWLAVTAIVVGALVALQPFSETLDALVPDVVVGPVAGVVTIVAGVALLLRPA